jgi:hypothetical protein
VTSSTIDVEQLDETQTPVYIGPIWMVAVGLLLIAQVLL